MSTADAVLDTLGSDRTQSERQRHGPRRTQRPNHFQVEAFVISRGVVRVEPVASPCIVQRFRVIVLHISHTPRQINA